MGARALPARLICWSFLAASLCASVAACTGADARRSEYYQRGEALYWKGEYLQARLELRKALQVDEGFAKGYSLLGDLELKLGNLPGAYHAFAKSAEIDPADPHTQLQLGKLLLVQGETAKARVILSHLLQSRPEGHDALLLQGALRIASAEPEGAVSALAGLAAQGVAAPDSYLLLALAHQMGGNDPAAERALLEGIARSRYPMQLRRALADLYARQGKNGQAAAQIREILRLEPADYRYRLTLADLLWRTGRHDEARAELQALMGRSGHEEGVVAAVARFYAEHNQRPEAEQLLVEGMAAKRKTPRLHLELADLYVRTGRPHKAVLVLEECLLLERDLSRPEVLAVNNALATLYLERGEIAKARRITKSVLRNRSWDYDANLTKGRLNLLLGEAPAAVAALRTAVRLRPNEARGYLLLAEGYLLNDDMVLALDTLQEARRLEPRSTAVTLALAKFHQRRHDFPAAARELAGALAVNQGDPELLAALGDVRLAAGDHKGAEGYYRAVVRNPAGEAMGRKKLAELYSGHGMAERAEGELLQGLQSAPESADLFERLILLYLEEGKVDEAASQCRRRITSHPEEATAYLLVSRLAGAEGAFDKAETFLREAELRGAPAVQTSLMRAQLRVLSGDQVAAKMILKDLLTAEPDSLAAANDYAYLLANSAQGGRELRKALKFAEQVVARRPDDPAFKDTLGWILYLRGDYGKAAPLLQQAAARLARNPVVQYHAGMALYRTGKLDPARNYLRAAARSRAPFAARKVAMATLQAMK